MKSNLQTNTKGTTPAENLTPSDEYGVEMRARNLTDQHCIEKCKDQESNFFDEFKDVFAKKIQPETKNDSGSKRELLFFEFRTIPPAYGSDDLAVTEKATEQKSEDVFPLVFDPTPEDKLLEKPSIFLIAGDKINFTQPTNNLPASNPEKGYRKGVSLD